MTTLLHPDKALLKQFSSTAQLTDDYKQACQQIENALNKFSSALHEMSKEQLEQTRFMLVNHLAAGTLHPVLCQHMLEQIRKKTTGLEA